MPKREDETYSNIKENRKSAYKCPYCGSQKIYFNVTFMAWRCEKCENSFKVPEDA
jgi:ribosomal protein L37AE/L43A